MDATTINKRYYNNITIAYVVCLLFSNIGAIKICDFWGFAIDAGTIIFPLLYILNDVLTEVYGFTASRKTILLALFYNIIFSVFIYIVILLPASPFWHDQQAFETIFLISPRIVIASIVSYFVGELINALIMSLLKIKFHGKIYALRAVFSTLIGSLIDTSIFSYIAFWGRIPQWELIKMIGLLTIIKVTYEIIALPLTIKFVNFLKKADNSDVYEKPSLKGLIRMYKL